MEMLFFIDYRLFGTFTEKDDSLFKSVMGIGLFIWKEDW